MRFSAAKAIGYVTLGAAFIWQTSCVKVAPLQPPDIVTGTTSHIWTFQIDKLGADGFGGDLYDVTIVNDSLAYAVGEIHLKDSIGQYDPDPYNCAIWHGKNWELRKIPYYYQGQALYSPIYSVMAFGADDVWFGIGNLIHWTGGKFVAVEVGSAFYGRVLKMWGTSSSDFYIVGDFGSIAKYQGGTWQKVQTGTGLTFYDVFGAGGVVLAIASNPSQSSDRKIVELSGTSALSIPSDQIPAALMGVWIVPFQTYYVVGNGVYQKNILQASWTHDPVDTSFTLMSSIRGNASNDILVAGSFGEIFHFNGENWQSYRQQTAIQSGGYGSVAIKGNVAIAVGLDNPFAVAAVGRRN